MLISIGAYDICNGTLAGGVAISDLRLKSDRLWDWVVPIGEVDCLLLDRITSKTDLTFTVKRTHASKPISEQFILQLDTNLPTTGTVTITTTGPTPDTRIVGGGFIVDHELLLEDGATTYHQYHVIGGPPVAP